MFLSIFFVLIHNFVALVLTFRTETCSHEKLQVELKAFENCMEADLSFNVCSTFQQMDTCFSEYYGKCLKNSEVKEVKENGKAVLRKALDLIMEDQQLQYGGFSHGSMLDNCENIPSHEEALHADSRLIIWLDHATTDNNCSKHDKDIVNYGAFQCLESRRHGMETDMRKLLVRRNEIQENVCQLLSETVGVCMKTDIPVCFSQRERMFIVEKMVGDFKEIFSAMEELMGYQLNINISVCSIWSSDLLLATSDLERVSSGSDNNLNTIQLQGSLMSSSLALLLLTQNFFQT